MSWFWGSKGKGADPADSLDPDLKKFLDKQQPKPYTPAEPPKPLAENLPTPSNSSTSRSQTQAEPSLPKESLFQDGRYKHIWKTYVPQQQEVEEEKAPAEKIILAKKDRRETLHQAALENCVFEQEMQQNCFSTGDASNRVRATMTMCRQEVKAFNRCYQLQAKFLQALGYMASATTSSADEEAIQMHADKLYHRMMDYEASVEEAKQTGAPIPPLSSVFNPKQPAPTIEEINLPPKMEKLLKKPLRELPPHERELAARAILQEAKVAQVYADDMFKYTTTLNEDRQNRQKWLVTVFGEVVGKFFIPDAPGEHKVKTFDNSALERDIWKQENNADKS